MIELRNYKRMHVYRASRTRDLVSARVYTNPSRGGEIKTLRSNLAPKEGGGAFIRGGGIIEQVR